jgi:GT2 family glycosyltransferase
MNLKYYFFKVTFKCVEKLLSLYTSLKYIFEPDKTKILLKYRDASLVHREQERLCHDSSAFALQRILIVIPFRDRWYLTRQCLQSLLTQKSENMALHVVLVNNNSKEKETLEGMQEALRDMAPLFASFKVEDNPIPFNFSKLNNDAVKNFHGSEIDIILCLNNDIEFQTENDLTELVSFFANTKNIGILGCTLVYPFQEKSHQIIQHSFLAPGVKHGGAHPLKGSVLNLKHAWFETPRLVPCVTGAVFFISYENFVSLGGFDENLPVSYQDLDLCLKCQQKGLDNWTLTRTVLTHYESASGKKKHDRNELNYIYKKWGTFLTHNPRYSQKYSRWSEKPIEALWEGDYPWEKVVG